jgi:hypothetical protein
MTFKEKISKIVRFNKLGINSPSGLEGHIKAGVGAITKYLKNDEEPGEDTIKKILDLPGLNKEWWETGNGAVFSDEPAIKHASVQNGTDNKGKSAEAREGAYRTIVEGYTEYYLIPKTIFQEKYILVALDQFNKEQEKWSQDKATFDRLLDLFESTLGKKEKSESKPQGTENAKEGA